MTKIFCTEMASRVVDRAIQIHGGVGLTTELPLEYWFRQVRSIRITEGVTEVLALAHGPQPDPRARMSLPAARETG